MRLHDAITQNTVEQRKLPIIRFKTQLNVVQKPPYQNPSPHVISVLTLICDIGKTIDINTRAFTYAVANEMYLDNRTTNENNKKIKIVQIQHITESFNIFDLKETFDETFNNQCTMIVEIPSNKRIYVKLFNTGTLHFTGLTSMEDAELCTNMIIERIHNQLNKSRVLEHIHDLSFKGAPFKVTPFRKKIIEKTIEKPIEKIIEKIIRYDIFSNFIKYVPLKDVYRLSHVCKRFFAILRDEHFWQYCIKQQFQLNYRQNKYSFFPDEQKNNRTISINLNSIDSNNSNIPTSNKLISNKPISNKRIISLKPEYFQLRSFYNKTTEYRPIVRFYPLKNDEQFKMSNHSIEMINSNFTTHFCINQRALTKILQKENPFLNISFEPDDKYHGIKIYWPCSIQSNDSQSNDSQSNEIQSNITKIFISVFRTGSILMSGAKKYSQLTSAYNFINDTIKRHYDKIWISNYSDV